MKRILILIFLSMSAYSQVLYRNISADDNIVTNEVDPQAYVHTTNDTIHVTSSDKDSWNSKASTNYVNLAIAAIPASDSTRIINITSNLFVSISSDSNLLMYSVSDNVTNYVKTFASYFELTNALTDYVSSPYQETNKVSTIWKGTYAEYNSLVNKSDNTTYIITDDTQYKVNGIYQEYDEYTSIVSPMTTSVYLVDNKDIYKVNIITNMMIGFDFTEINFNNKIATWELWLNYTSTNHSIGWVYTTNQLYWVSGDPTFDNVGVYYYVMRAFSPTNIHANIQYMK